MHSLDMKSDLQQQLSGLDAKQAAMVDLTIELANINSGSLNADGVNAVGEAIVNSAADLGATLKRVTSAPYRVINDRGEWRETPLGDAFILSKHPQAKRRILLAGHLDTVFPPDSHFQTCTWLDDNTLNGPGVADLKGGLVLMLEALRVLENSPLAGQIGWDVLLNPDEEIGSPSSAHLFTELAQQCQIGMIYEPCMPNGHLAGDRKGSGNFSLVCKGLAAHAGREHHLGRNAIRALCDAMAAIDELNGQWSGVTFNPGYIHGGGALNIVPDNAVGKFNVRVATMQEMVEVEQALHSIVAEINQRDGISLQLHGSFGRPPKVVEGRQESLYQLAAQCGKELGLDLQWHPTGGCCDGNNLAAAGVINIDTLGIQGGKIHSDAEYLLADAFVPRAQLSAMLLLQLASQPDHRCWQK
jgi:glutamate carboxypeptidase